MVTSICLRVGEYKMSPGESMTYDARIRYWEEEWLSQLLEEALRLKGSISNREAASGESSA